MAICIVGIGSDILLNKRRCVSSLSSSHQKICIWSEGRGVMRIELKRRRKLILSFRPFLFYRVNLRQVEANNRIVRGQLFGNKKLCLRLAKVSLLHQRIRE